MACDMKETLTWNEKMSECIRITMFFDSNNMPLPQATEIASADQNECCEAAFNLDDPAQKAALLMACP